MNSTELQNRLFVFAKDCQRLTILLPKTAYNFEYSSQLIRSSASPGANYIEAIESLGTKDFVHRLRICRKEAKESVYWLMLIQDANGHNTKFESELVRLIDEANQITRIFSASINTWNSKQKAK